MVVEKIKREARVAQLVDSYGAHGLAMMLIDAELREENKSLEINELSAQIDRLARFAAMQGLDLRDLSSETSPDLSYDEWRSLPNELQSRINRITEAYDRQQEEGQCQ